MRKLIFSIIFIFLILFITIPNNPNIARKETFEDTPLVCILSSKTIDVGNFPYLNVKGGLKYTRPLSLWQTGEDVMQIKKSLKKIGYNIRTTSYIFDQNMKDVILKFQYDQGIKVDGVIGQETINTINKILIENGMTPPIIQTIVSNPPTNGYWITINKSSNTLTLLKGNQIIEKFPVATGKNPKLTPEGKLIIQNKIINPAWKNIEGGVPQNPLGYRWMGLNIDDGYLYGIHGTNNEGSIGYFVSNGCIRMKNSDVEKIFNIVKQGTPVWIGTQEKLANWGYVIK
ncbi:L,D-transpeptidase family protein [Defluviitalea phaphyphila]|uniref:L,D-transpeptidase family protein n=1 Tax=Defluviitalea phaphyphila TaxID=1473580 RepID=UPI0007314BF7|nr:L,D-transpeptidase family protein [Defluviitalea phaphyphila]